MAEIDFEHMHQDHIDGDRYLRKQILRHKKDITPMLDYQGKSPGEKWSLPLDGHPFVVPTPKTRKPPQHGGDYNDLSLARIELRKHSVGNGGTAAHNYYAELKYLLYELDEAIGRDVDRANQIWNILYPALMDEIKIHKYDALFFDPWTTAHRRCDVHIRETTEEETEGEEWPYLRQPHSGYVGEPGSD